MKRKKYVKQVTTDAHEGKPGARHSITESRWLLQSAVSLTKEGSLPEAEQLLSDFVSRMPPGWKPVKETEKQLEIAFWDENEFLNYSFANTATKGIIYVTPSYSQGYYLLGALAVEQKDLAKALDYLDKGPGPINSTKQGLCGAPPSA